MDIFQLSATQLARKIKQKEIGAAEVTALCLERIRKEDADLGSFLFVDEEGALRRAAYVQEGIDSGKITSPLAGVPVAVKDNLCSKDMPTSAASRMLEHYRSPYTATAVANLEDAGMVVLGKTNMDEFGMGSTTETSAFQATKNPVNPAHVPGGSSGGSAAAVAAKLAFGALGTDTGGSIRQPAAYCGIAGLKPTYGTVSRYGMIAFGSSLDQIGPLTKNVEDAANFLHILASFDEKDSTSHRRSAIPVFQKAPADLHGLKIGIPKEFLQDGLDEEIRTSVMESVHLFEKLGASVSEYSLAILNYTMPAYYVLSAAEASSNLARFDGSKYGLRADAYEGLEDMYQQTRSRGFGKEVQRRVMFGTLMLSSHYKETYYQKACKVRERMKQEMQKAFASYDLLVGPTAPQAAPLLGQEGHFSAATYLSDVYTAPANLTGIPALSLPCGFTKNGLPIGLQLMAKHWQEALLFQAASAIEEALSIT